LGCPPDEIQVHDEDGENKSVVSLQLRMFQKRLRISKNVKVEYVIGGVYSMLGLFIMLMSITAGRIWCLCFEIGPKNQRVSLTLSKYSMGVKVVAVLLIEARREKPGCATPPEVLRIQVDEFASMFHFVPTHSEARIC